MHAYRRIGTSMIRLSHTIASQATFEQFKRLIDTFAIDRRNDAARNANFKGTESSADNT